MRFYYSVGRNLLIVIQILSPPASSSPSSPLPHPPPTFLSLFQVRSYYGVGRNLLIRFKDDSIDETSELADTLAVASSVADRLDLSMRTLPGDHARPLQQVRGCPVPSVQCTFGS